MPDGQPTFDAASVRTQFLIVAVTWWIGYPLCVVIDLLPSAHLVVRALLSLVMVPTLIVSVVFGCILLYRQWFLLQGYGARTTPGKAVGFGFIPFYCFYWWFVAYAGLATDTNRHLASEGLKAPRMSFGLSVASCVLGILACTVGLIPKVYSLLLIPGMIIGFILVVQQKDCILAMLEQRNRADGIPVLP